jgi:hypothetical protein
MSAHGQFQLFIDSLRAHRLGDQRAKHVLLTRDCITGSVASPQVRSDQQLLCFDDSFGDDRSKPWRVPHRLEDTFPAVPYKGFGRGPLARVWLAGARALVGKLDDSDNGFHEMSA